MYRYVLSLTMSTKRKCGVIQSDATAVGTVNYPHSVNSTYLLKTSPAAAGRRALGCQVQHRPVFFGPLFRFKSSRTPIRSTRSSNGALGRKFGYRETSVGRAVARVPSSRTHFRTLSRTYVCFKRTAIVLRDAHDIVVDVMQSSVIVAVYLRNELTRLCFFFVFALRSETRGGIRRSSEAARRRRRRRQVVVTKPAPRRHVHHVQFPSASLCMSFVNYTWVHCYIYSMFRYSVYLYW